MIKSFIFNIFQELKYLVGPYISKVKMEKEKKS